MSDALGTLTERAKFAVDHPEVLHSPTALREIIAGLLSDRDQSERAELALVSIRDAYVSRSELFTNDADCAANLHDRAVLAIRPA